ncbi:MAG: URC4/urg3 family protein, partial [Pseudomonadota bacterium]|nr:URC4/urg3 family protein [Pseudomonadota bacterium]
LGPIWPGRLCLDGENLGDVWPHPLVAPAGPAPGLVPFHKLSQWLTYSLIEVFEDAGVPVTGLDALTGLPEYRNGGLFLDTGVLRLRDPSLAGEVLPVDHAVIVEWRALTVALLDRVAAQVRARLGVSAEEMPLARVLEGGTWAAGRRLAQGLREGAPPLRVASDGTVF